MGILTEGYSHYYSHKGFSDKGWLAFTKDVGAIVRKAKKKIRASLDSDGTYIMFNGEGQDGYEDLVITLAPQEGFNFVKTGGMRGIKAYDPFVVEILKAAKKRNRSMKLKSDGGKEVFEGMDLRRTNEGLADLVEGMLDPDENDLDDHGMDAATQKRLRVKRMHKPKGAKRVKKPMRTHLPYHTRNV